jgi:hypothetical protein
MKVLLRTGLGKNITLTITLIEGYYPFYTKAHSCLCL